MNTAASETVPATVEMTFKVCDERKAWFEHEMAKLIRRAVRMGCPAPSFTFGAYEDTQDEDLSDDDRALAFDVLAEHGMTEADARARFEEHKSRGW